MIQLGYHITEKDDKLNKIEVSDLCKLMTDSTLDLETQIKRLRTMLQIDLKKYNQLKLQLPYFTSSVFFPPYRKTENFAYTLYFVLDFDYLLQKEMDIDELKNKLADDERVVLIFTSPGGNGLKTVFKLSENCSDPNKYKLFYHEFGKQFSDQYGLQQVIDTKTSDVARACFLSFDPDLRYRADAVPVDMNSIINFENEGTLDHLLHELPESVPFDIEAPSELPQLTEDVFDVIRQKLNPKARQNREKQFYVPEKIKSLEKKILLRAAEVGIKVVNSRNIQYGKQFTFEVDGNAGEINVFHGKRGFTVVKSTKSGCVDQVNEIGAMLVSDVIISQTEESTTESIETIQELLTNKDEIDSGVDENLGERLAE